MLPVRTRIKKKKKQVWFYSESCRYDVIFDNVKKSNWKRIDDEKLEGHSNIIWIDVSVIQEKMRTILPWQIINHCPGMPNIARKNRMGQNLNKMQKEFPKEYSFYPKTWVLPNEIAEFRLQFDESGCAKDNNVFIVKPDGGAQGRGIFLTNTLKSVPLHENVVAQTYLKKPMLIDGFKFDLRIYVYVASVKPLRVYLFNDGLARICTEPYLEPTSENMSHSCMHLTNYAVNKSSATFQQPTIDEYEGESGDGVSANKRSLSWFLKWVEERHGKSKADSLFQRIGTIAMRTILSIAPTLCREHDFHFSAFRGVPVGTRESEQCEMNADEGDDEDAVDEGDGTKEEEEVTNIDSTDSTYKNISVRGSRCFQVLGLDIMVDQSLCPWLVEVNHLPSFGTDSPLDLDVKDRLMAQVFSTIAALPDDERAFKRHQRAEAKSRLCVQRNVDLDKNKENGLESAHRRADRHSKSFKYCKQNKEPAEGYEPLQKITEEDALDAECDDDDEEEVEAKQTVINLNNAVLTSTDAAISATDDSVHVEPHSSSSSSSSSTVGEIKKQLRRVYEAHCPEKAERVEALLRRYKGFEQQFLQYVLEKYGLTTKEDTSITCTTTETATTIITTEELENETAASSLSGISDSNKETTSQLQRRRRIKQLRIPRHPPFRTPSSGPLSEIKTRLLDSSISNRKCRCDSEDIMCAREVLEEMHRKEVLGQMWSEELTDPWLAREKILLPSFMRLFPPPIEIAKDCEEEQGGEEAEESNQDQVEEDCIKNSYVKRSPSATLQEIMLKVFDMDRKQMMRMTRPLRESTPEKERMPETSSNNTCTIASPEEVAEAVRLQAEAINRLYLGFSCSVQQQAAMLDSKTTPWIQSQLPPTQPRSKVLTANGRMTMQVPIVPRTFDFESAVKISNRS